MDVDNDSDGLILLDLFFFINWDVIIEKEWLLGEDGVVDNLVDFIENLVCKYKDGRDILLVNGILCLLLYLYFGEVFLN